MWVPRVSLPRQQLQGVHSEPICDSLDRFQGEVPVPSFNTPHVRAVHTQHHGERFLAKADRDWLAQVISRRVSLAKWREAYQRTPTDVKVVLEFDTTNG